MTNKTQIFPDVITFLLGAGPLDGVRFGEVPEGKPPYWWRRALRELFEARTPAIADGVEMEWQPIETAPMDGTDVLVMYMHIDTQVVHNAFYANEKDGWEPEDYGWWSYEHNEVSRIKLDDWMTPTHWMPLPAAPKMEGKECTHEGYSFKKHGRCCPHCGEFLTDFGD